MVLTFHLELNDMAEFASFILALKGELDKLKALTEQLNVETQKLQIAEENVDGKPSS